MRDDDDSQPLRSARRSPQHRHRELNLGEGLGDFWLATDAYIYGYPLVTMEMTRRVFTNVAKPEGTHAPMGQLIKMREYPTPARFNQAIERIFCVFNIRKR